MPYCPQCRSEYRAGFTRCTHCDVALVATLPTRDATKNDRLRAAAAEGSVLEISRSSYSEACQMVGALHAAGVDAMVGADPSTLGKDGVATHYFAWVLPEDRDAATEALRAEWSRLLEGSVVGKDAEELDLDAEGEHRCPACGAAFGGVVTECPDCGLFLGGD